MKTLRTWWGGLAEVWKRGYAWEYRMYRLKEAFGLPEQKTVKLEFVFDDWRKQGVSVYNTEEGIELSLWSFHSGTTFRGEITLDPDEAKELNRAMARGFQPVFWVTPRGY